MGFLDDLQSTMNRGMDSANRTGRAAKLKMQRSDYMNQRKDLTAQLGASLYEATKTDPAFRTGREALYDGIATIDAQCAAIDAELQQINQQADEQARAAATYVCPTCGSTVRATQSFCMGCGASVASIIAAAGGQAPAAANGPRCPSCGAPISEGDLFCMSCGAKLGENA